MSLSETYAREVLGETPPGKESKRHFDENHDAEFVSSEKVIAALVVQSDSGIIEQRALRSEKEALTDKEIIKNMSDREGETPILRPPRIARIWISPWIDSSGDLHMESFIYTEIEGKKWVIGDEAPETTQRGLEKSYNPLR
jgi:hypothetical protein